jgi:restriction system protein
MREGAMTIPDFQSIMLPLLKVVADGQDHSGKELLDTLSERFHLSESELGEQIPSGKQGVFYNRLGWACTYLRHAGLLEAPRRAHYRITDRGRKVLESNPTRVDMRYLEQFPEYVAFRDRKGTKGARRKPGTDGEPLFKAERPTRQTPEEVLEDAFQEIRDSLAEELLALVKNASPSFFESLVVELLVKMGYGGSWQEASRAVGKTHDEGIDGIIDEDRLGLDSIYVQAKKWNENAVVGRPDIQRFVGALAGKRARKGVFITTSSFSTEAVSYVSNIDSRVVLIDGKRLAEFMIDYDVGVATATSYRLKRVDSDYFGCS